MLYLWYEIHKIMKENLESIRILRKKIEEQSGIRLELPEHYKDLCEYINEKLRELTRKEDEPAMSLSLKTILRLWEKEKYGSEPRQSTLNALVSVAGYHYWGEFIDEVEKDQRKPEKSVERKEEVSLIQQFEWSNPGGAWIMEMERMPKAVTPLSSLRDNYNKEEWLKQLKRRLGYL